MAAKTNTAASRTWAAQIILFLWARLPLCVCPVSRSALAVVVLVMLMAISFGFRRRGGQSTLKYPHRLRKVDDPLWPGLGCLALRCRAGYFLSGELVGAPSELSSLNTLKLGDERHDVAFAGTAKAAVLLR